MGYNTFHDMLDQDQAEREGVYSEGDTQPIAAAGKLKLDHSAIDDNETLEDQIAREIKELLDEPSIKAQKDKSAGLAYIQDKAAWIARGAAFKAMRIERNKREQMMPASGGTMLLSDEEIETIMTLRNGTAKVIPVGEYEKAANMILKTATESPLVETFAPVDPLMAYLERQWEWSMSTFGPGLRTTGILNHIRKELGEVEKEPFDLMEWIDIVILALDGYWRHGGSALRLLTLLQHKQDKNFGRNWPDWRERSEDQAIEHDRSHEQNLVEAIDALK